VIEARLRRIKAPRTLIDHRCADAGFTGRRKREMKTNIGARRVLSIMVGAALGAWGCSAGAAGFAIANQGGSGLGNAFVGQVAAAEDASTIFFNPAGLTLLPGRQVVAGLAALKPSIKFNDAGSTTPTSPLPSPPGFASGGNGGEAAGWAFVPQGYLAWELVPGKMWAGVGLSAPFGLTTEWDSDWVGRFHAVKSDLMAININPSIAWKVNEMFSVGGGVNAQYIRAELTRQVPYGAITLGRVLGSNPAGCGSALAVSLGGCAAEGESKVQGHDWTLGWNIGAMMTLAPATRVGVHYRSSIKHTLKGDVSFSNVPNYGALGPAGAPLVAALANGDVSADIEVPASFAVGLSHQLTSRLQILADYQWTGWNSVQSLVINRTSGGTLTTEELRFKNGWRAGVAANYVLDDRWKLRAGVARDNSPVEDAFRTPRLPDASRTWLAVGVQMTLSKQLAIDVGYAHEFVKDVSSNLASALSPTDIPKGNLVGTYKTNVNLLGVQMRYSF
jgi:long-chain fatty acid transport protein